MKEVTPARMMATGSADKSFPGVWMALRSSILPPPGGALSIHPDPLARAKSPYQRDFWAGMRTFGVRSGAFGLAGSVGRQAGLLR